MITRKETRCLPPEELLALRRAMIQFHNETETDLWGYVAGIHGVPKNIGMQNHGDTFLAWHRVYIWYFENKLKEIDSTLSLPYWNWTLKDYFAHPIAPPHDDAKFIDADGLEKDNPLNAGPIYHLPYKTTRNPIFTSKRMNNTMQRLTLAFGQQQFPNFNALMFGPHQDIHMYFGRTSQMSNLSYAAYDPIFWSHHAEVDRQWAVWQKLHPNADVPNKDKDLEGPWTKKIRDVLDYQNGLGYQYDDLTIDVEKFRNVHGFLRQRIFLEIEDISMDVVSYFADVYLINNMSKEKAYAGTFSVFGMGYHMRMNSHMHQPMKSNQYVDITDALIQLDADKNNVTIKLQAVDMNGNEIDEDKLSIGDIKFVSIADI